jgi:[lysine-biosynthesis-protein LysW]--L-2-aminoadipate ligase
MSATPLAPQPPLLPSPSSFAEPRALVVATVETGTNMLLADAFAGLGYRSEIVMPGPQLTAGPGDVVLGRLDVRRTLDGVEDGLWELARLERSGAQLLNGPQALFAAHDKLATALMLARAGVPHPATAHVTEAKAPRSIVPPYVVKPRFGSWGCDVFKCETDDELEERLAELAERPWFRGLGAVVQELVPADGVDMRLVVAGGSVVGAIERVAAPGEWRTNVALGAVRRRVVPPTAARQVAVRAAAALGADLAGIDLLVDARGEYIVLEVNGAVDFTSEYAQDGDVFSTAVRSLVPAASAAGLAAV